MPPKRGGLAQRLQRLEGVLSQLTVSARAAPGPSAQPKRKRARRRKRGVAGPVMQTMSPTDVVLSKLELCDTLKVAASQTTATGQCDLKPSSLPFLSNISKCFERIKWLRVRAMYKPAASMTQAGLVSVGVDWNWSGTATTRKQVACYTPNNSGPVWKEFVVQLPANRLQSRLWYNISSDPKFGPAEQGPAQVVWAIDASGGSSGLTAGELWVEYTVVLSGTTA